MKVELVVTQCLPKLDINIHGVLRHLKVEIELLQSHLSEGSVNAVISGLEQCRTEGPDVEVEHEYALSVSVDLSSGQSERG